MTREEAEALADRLNREAADHTQRRVARKSADGWEVVKVRVPKDLT